MAVTDSDTSRRFGKFSIRDALSRELSPSDEVEVAVVVFQDMFSKESFSVDLFSSSDSMCPAGRTVKAKLKSVVFDGEWEAWQVYFVMWYFSLFFSGRRASVTRLRQGYVFLPVAPITATISHWNAFIAGKSASYASPG